MSIPKESIKEFQEIYKKEYGKELPYEEAADTANRLFELYKIIIESKVEELKLIEKLKTQTKGFSLMDGKTYNCGICHASIKDEQLWYDKWGKKCLACQSAVDKKIIPGNICYNDKDWYASWEFDSYFKLKSPTVKKLIRQGILKARIVPDTGFEIILIKENIETLPPKDLIKYVSIPDKDNPKAVTITPWYEVRDPRKTLEKFKIWPHLKAFHAKPESPNKTHK